MTRSGSGGGSAFFLAIPRRYLPLFASAIEAQTDRVRGTSSRSLVALCVMVGGSAAVPIVVPYPEWTVVPWLLVGAIGGVIAGRASRVAVAWLAALIGVPLILAVREVGLYGQLLVVGVPFAIALVANFASIGFIAGSVLVTRRQTLPPPASGLAGHIATLALAAGDEYRLRPDRGHGFSLYVGANGARTRVEGGINADCRTPAALGWTYESINYDQRDDATLNWRQKAAGDGTLQWDCDSQGAYAGDEVVASDGVPIAGWYIPSATNPDPPVRRW